MEHMAGQLKVGKRFALLFGAMFILVVAVLLRVEYLFYMSFALAVTPGVAWLFARRGTLYVEASRSMTGVVKAGERLPMRIELENTGATRKQLLVMRDTLPSGLVAEGPSERFVTDVLPGEMVAVEYPVTARRRGVYPLGWIDLVCWDPLGLYTHSRELPAEATLVVHPRPVPLPLVKPPSGGRQFSNRTRARRRGEGTDFRGVREYTPGDDLRRIHWKQTAKRQKLTVVEYESGEANNVAVVLDLSPGFHAGVEDESTLEYGVTLAASIASQALKRGSEFTLVAECAKSYSLRSLATTEDETAVMDALARVRATSASSFAETLMEAEQWIPPGAGVVVISPAAGEEVVASATRLSALGHGVLWISLDAGSFAKQTGQKPPADDLA
ncbi:MAG TPA: DUF58 domain-containing protein, partial [Armatimonadota bacterium]|nr:DUF58 domain-containing protein [Armatimonadota bacterium]